MQCATCDVCKRPRSRFDCDFCFVHQLRSGKIPVLTPPGWKPVRVEYVSQHDVDANPKNFNSNFHADLEPVESGVSGVSSWLTPATAALMASAPWTSVELAESELSELLRLGKLAQFRKLHHTLIENDTVLSVAKKIDAAIAAAGKTGTRMFARLDECSFKRSAHLGAFMDGRQILRAFVEDARVRGWLEAKNATSAKLWLSDFDDRISADKEFRVFVHKGVVVGISQYDWQNTSEPLGKLSEDSLEKLGVRIKNFAMDCVTTLLTDSYFDTWTAIVDVAVLGDVAKDSPRLIEFTSFGGHGGCGSALFHWKRDYDILYSGGSTRTTVMRVVRA